MCVFRLGDQHCRFTKISTIFVSSFAKKLVLTLFSFTLTQIQNKKKMPNFFLSNWSVCKFCLASKWAVFVFTSVAIPKPLVRYTSRYAILSVALVNLLVRNIYVYIFLFSIVSLSQVKLHICELVLSEKKRNWRVWRTCSEFTPISAMLVFSLLRRRGWWETPVLLPSNLKPHASRQQF